MRAPGIDNPALEAALDDTYIGYVPDYIHAYIKICVLCPERLNEALHVERDGPKCRSAGGSISLALDRLTQMVPTDLGMMKLQGCPQQIHILPGSRASRTKPSWARAEPGLFSGVLFAFFAFFFSFPFSFAFSGFEIRSRDLRCTIAGGLNPSFQSSIL